MLYHFRKNISLLTAAILTASVLLTGCGTSAADTDTAEATESADVLQELTADVKGATSYTIEKNEALYSELDFEDTTEEEFAVRGLIDAPEELELTDDDGNVIWSQKAYDFTEDTENIPDTVNPSLWRNTVNNHVYGLFEVTDGIYQVRGYDMSNLTLIEGDTGWIIIDTMMSTECSQAAMQLVEKNLGTRPVKAVILSHSHVDHFGGIKGLISQEDVADASLSLSEQLASGKIPVIVPEGFEEYAVSENVYAGKAMGRRANYQYGSLLAQSVTGTLAMGIGMGQSTGTISYISPTYEIKETGESYVIDGVELEFQLTPGTEAPAEMNTWLPQKKALWVAENCTGTLHNLYTLRGAQVRDGAAWAQYLCEAIARYGTEVEVTFQSHNWPHWGNDVVNDYLVSSAAVYKFINDQTLTYMNQGYTSDEISNMIALPEALEKKWYTRGYYGTVAHNAKAVYQKYLGWYDANPVNLDPLTPEESAQKWAEYLTLGGIDESLAQAKKDFDNGEYQWVAEFTNKLVYADPTNEAARLLCADALEQLGYQAESGTWRNAYLTGAKELREGNSATATASNSQDIMKNMTFRNIFDYIAILLDKEAVADEDFTLNVTLSDTGENYAVRFKNGAVLVFDDFTDTAAAVSVTTQKNALFLLISGDYDTFLASAQITGDGEKLKTIADNLTELDISESPDFNIIEP